MESVAVYLAYLWEWASLGTTALVLLAVLAGSAGIGFVTFLGLSRVRSGWIRIPASLVVALFTFLVAALVLGGRAVLLPATDAPTFTNRKSVIVTAAIRNNPNLVLTLRFPTEAQVSQDVELDLVVPVGPEKSPEESAVLRVGSEVRVRTGGSAAGCLPAAASTSSSKPDDAFLACPTPDRPGFARYRWFIRSDKPGRSIVVITAPVRALAPLHQAEWTATVASDEKIWSRTEAAPIELQSNVPRQWQGVIDHRSNLKEKPIVLTPAAPEVRYGGYEVNLGAGEFLVPLEFQNTLGVSAGTYAILALGGTVLSTLLGSGWLWQLLTWLRQRNRPTAPHIPFGKRKPKPD